MKVYFVDKEIYNRYKNQIIQNLSFSDKNLLEKGIQNLIFGGAGIQAPVVYQEFLGMGKLDSKPIIDWLELVESNELKEAIKKEYQEVR